MLPSGAPTEETVVALSKLLAAGDAIIDGGNSFYKDDVRRSAMLKPSGIHYLDVGTSGGIWGLERGYCMMIGGDQSSAERLDPIFATLAPGPGNPENSWPRANEEHRGSRLSLLWRGRRGTLCEDDP